MNPAEAERYAALILILEAVDVLWDEYTITHDDVSAEPYIWLNNTVLRVQQIAEEWGREIVKP